MDRTARDAALEHGGVLTRQHVLAIGFTPDQIRNRLASGDWEPVPGRAYRILAARSHIDLLKSATHVLPLAVASHESAAELLAVPRVRRGRAVVSVHTRTTHSFPGVVVRRNHDLLPEHVTEVDGLPVTTVERTVVDLASTFGEEHLGDILDDLAAMGRLDRRALGDVIGVVARRGRPGAALLNRLRDEYVDGAPIPPSVMERRGRQLLVSVGLPPPVPEYPIPWSRSRRFDDAYPDSHVAIEWDSRRWHMSRDSFDSDRRRDNAAHRNGWHVFRFTWRDITTRPHYVVATVRAAVGA